MENLFVCPCCGEKTLEEQGAYDICEVCNWEDDPGQAKHPDDPDGANLTSLNEARAEWEKKKAAAV